LTAGLTAGVDVKLGSAFERIAGGHKFLSAAAQAVEHNLINQGVAAAISQTPFSWAGVASAAVTGVAGAAIHESFAKLPTKGVTGILNKVGEQIARNSASQLVSLAIYQKGKLSVSQVFATSSVRRSAQYCRRPAGSVIRRRR